MRKLQAYLRKVATEVQWTLICLVEQTSSGTC